MRSLLRPLILVLATLLCIGALNAGLPREFTRKGSPALYRSMRKKAAANLSRLDKPIRKQYRKMLDKHGDLVMSFLLAHESDANLMLAKPADVLSNYTEICDLLTKRGTTHSPEFFLSYVARQTVSDERIEAYRRALLDDGLRRIMETAPNEVELYRAVSQWCVQRLVFKQTSGRDQSPLDITRKSIFGRCEEMQILFVAAARTVGLAARPASTPWWAHTDNNHAWAEVWLDGAWHYTGDMDAAYYPDQTWFSGMIDKTVLILADGSLPDASDEVLSAGKYEALINSIRNYAGERTRTLNIQTLDEKGSPLGNCAIGIMVYNWGALRPLTYVNTDEKGRLSISVGRGAFYVAAIKDKDYAISCVESGPEDIISLSIRLSQKALPDQDRMLVYPSNPFEWKQAPQEWNEGVNKAKQAWNARDAAFKARSTALYQTEYDSLYWQVAGSCRGNYTEFALFASRHKAISKEFLAYLSGEDPKLLWQADADLFEAIYGFFNELDHAAMSDEALYSLVSPAVYFEDLPRPTSFENGVPRLYPKSFSHQGRSTYLRLGEAMRWLNKHYRIKANKALAGLLPMNIAASRKYLSPIQFRMLAVNVARANHIPAQFTRIPNVISVLINDDWRYYDIVKGEYWTGTAPSDALQGSVDINITDALGLPLTVSTEQLTLNRWQDGMFYTLNYSPESIGSGRYHFTVPAGEYYLQLGYRVSDSRTGFHLRHLQVDEGGSISITLSAPEYPRAWDLIDPLIAALLDDVQTELPDIVLIGNHDQENSRRVAEKILGQNREFVWFGFDEAVDPPANYFVLPAWRDMVTADQRHAVRTLTLIRKDSGWQSFEGLWEKLP